MRITFTIISCFLLFASLAQTGSLSGKVNSESNSQSLTGATIMVLETSQTVLSETDGTYSINDLNAGKYTLQVSYVGYISKKITDVEIVKGDITTVNIALTLANTTLRNVTVTSISAKRESLNALLVTRRNAAVVSDGISADMIRRSPDRNTSDVLKRVSGTSVQDNKYVIVRGMNDRYNEAMLNGIILPSSEPDRKTFAFDIFPSEIVDNITIYKSASPDLPGSFAGGLVQVTTKDVPERNFVALKTSLGFNSATINNDYYTYPGSKTDWLGFDNTVRVLPKSIEAIPTLDFNSLKLYDPAKKTTLDKSFLNNWAVYSQSSAPLNTAFQLSGGFNSKLSKNSKYPKLGGIFGVTYSSTYNYIQQERISYTDPTLGDSGGADFKFFDSQYVQNILISALGNIALRINANNKIFINNLLSINSFDQTIIRGGSNIAVSRPYIQAYSYFFVSNRLFNTQIGGEHVLPKTKIKINWSGYYTDLQRREPDYRYLIYQKQLEEDPYNAVISSGGEVSTTESGLHFFGSIEDYSKGANADIVIPFKLLKNNQNFKVGGGYYYDDRRRDIRYFNTNISDNPTTETFDYLQLPVSRIFDTSHFNLNEGFYYSEPQLPNSYYGNVQNAYGYVMLDNKLTSKLRVVWGMRLENYQNVLKGLDANFEPTTFTDLKKADWLPSVNIIYSVLPKANLRASYSRTVTRPLFRELSPQSFYDFFLNINYFGNPGLVPTYIDNYEVRWEHFFENSQYYSVSVFYKKLKNAIEPVIAFKSVESLSLNYTNISEANNRGIELEARKDFGFIGKTFENLVLYANASFVQSKISAKDITNSKNDYRPLYGQSPFVINGSLQYSEPKSNLGISLLFNQAGTRLWLLNDIYSNIIWEKPRPIFDAKISKSFFKKGIIEFSWSDILHQDAIFFNDVDGNKKYNKDIDAVTIRRKYGYNMSLSLGYRF